MGPTTYFKRYTSIEKARRMKQLRKKTTQDVVKDKRTPMQRWEEDMNNLEHQMRLFCSIED